jgi:hypothetical protein
MADEITLKQETAYITPFVNVTIGGIDFPLRFTMRSVVNVLERDGRSLLSAADWNALEVEEVAEMLAMATEHITPRRTAAEFLRLLDANSVYAVINALQTSFTVAHEGDPDTARPFRLGHLE